MGIAEVLLQRYASTDCSDQSAECSPYPSSHPSAEHSHATTPRYVEPSDLDLDRSSKPRGRPRGARDARPRFRRTRKEIRYLRESNLMQSSVGSSQASSDGEILVEQWQSEPETAADAVEEVLAQGAKSQSRRRRSTPYQHSQRTPSEATAPLAHVPLPAVERERTPTLEELHKRDQEPTWVVPSCNQPSDSRTKMGGAFAPMPAMCLPVCLNFVTVMGNLVCTRCGWVDFQSDRAHRPTS